MPGARSSKATATRSPICSGDVGAVEQAADHPQVGLLVELDVDEHERHVVVEAGKERLPHDRPRTDVRRAAHRLELELRIGGDSAGSTTSGGMRERSAPRAPRHREHVSRPRPPRTAPTGRRGPGTGRDRSASTHGMTPASCSALIWSHVYPSSSRITSVCSPCSGARRRRRRLLVELHRHGRQAGS